MKTRVRRVQSANKSGAGHFLRSIRLQNILSFGPDGEELELKPLNVLIGPNAAGKSNVLNALRLLRAAPHDIAAPMRGKGGGVSEWLWKGGGVTGGATVEAVIWSVERERPCRYRIVFGEQRGRFDLMEETLTDAGKTGRVYFEMLPRRKRVLVANPGEKSRRLVNIGPNYEPNKSFLAQRQDRSTYPEISDLTQFLGQIRFYCDWNMGPHSALRDPQRPDEPQDFLEENASNLALVLNDLQFRGLGPDLLGVLQDLSDGVEDIKVKTYGGVVEFYLHERGLSTPTPPGRLSDGTLRYLCFAAMFCHPDPPSLICLEEPELGLHPDAIAGVARMLKTASERCQLIVTTHSPELVDALSDTPESVVVCERTERGTQMHRLDPKPLKEWVEEYRLGQIWKTGEIGGRR